MSLFEKKWFKIMFGIILFLLIVMLLKVNQFILTPIVVLLKTIFLPFVIAGILFYLCRPLVKLLVKKKVPRWIAIISAYLAMILIIYGIVKLVGPVINDQLETFVANLPEMVSTVTNWIKYLQENQNTFPSFIQDALLNASDNIQSKIEANVGNIANGILGVFSFIGGFINTIFYLVLVPFILFYMLKDGDQFAPSVAVLFPKSKKKHVLNILSEMDKTISTYIQGQMLVSIIVGILLFIGYLIIGLKYSLVLAMFGMFTNVIPFLGPYIAVIPAVLVALFQEPKMVLYVAIIMLIAQQIEGNVVSPNVMGKSLNIHPLTIIVLILTAGNLMGIIGIIFVIPAYSIGKVLVVNIIKIFKES
ncbi:AI-2E family transporter [Ferdinandcohnia quinoae]|uniref:AI-2E family transporter n=1 Tax=Fredinandcohnia quinoae TaxID=2918902 RepID=A0AAW5DZZ6_9BACI|nr:AI-2E family transporter [Fredinandcohnia sp. SECRCQ15]MCH1624004.1 AI-2E family transporter [Fredinandcohnia sp. SECRCQ15]